MGIGDFFKGLSRVFKGLFRKIAEVVPEEYLVHGIQLVEDAAVRFMDNRSRREWVINQLMTRFHIPESVARLVTEMAVTAVKNGIHKAGDSAEDAVDSDEG